MICATVENVVIIWRTVEKVVIIWATGEKIIWGTVMRRINFSKEGKALTCSTCEKNFGCSNPKEQTDSIVF